jgi:hypothetical protein
MEINDARSKLCPPSCRTRPVEEKVLSPGSPPITPEDLVKLGVELPLISSAVSTISQAEGSLDSLLSLSPAQVENLVDILDKVNLPLWMFPLCIKSQAREQVVSSPTVNQNSKKRCFRILRDVSRRNCILPKSYYPPQVVRSGTIPHTIGEYADIWEGHKDGKQVCVKAFRTATNFRAVKLVCELSSSQRGLSSLFQSEVIPRERGAEVRHTSECPTFPRGFRGVVPVLYHQPLAPKWEHQPVYREKP